MSAAVVSYCGVSRRTAARRQFEKRVQETLERRDRKDHHLQKVRESQEMEKVMNDVRLQLEEEERREKVER